MGEERAAVEAYARAAAQLADPFAERAEVLREMGLDETGWARLDGQWRAEIARRSAAGDRALADVFAAAFAEEKLRLSLGRGARDVAPASVGVPAASIDSTGAARVVLEPALPFTGTRSSPPGAGPVSEVDARDLDTTAEMDEGDGLGVTLPFEKD